MQLSQPCPKLFAQSAKIFQSKSEKKFENYLEKIEPQRSSGQVGFSFDNPAERFLLKNRILCCLITEIVYNNFPKILLFPKCSSGQLECKFDNTAEKISHNL